MQVARVQHGFVHIIYTRVRLLQSAGGCVLVQQVTDTRVSSDEAAEDGLKI